MASTNDQLIQIMKERGLTCANVSILLHKSMDCIKKWRQTKNRVVMDMAYLELLKIKLISLDHLGLTIDDIYKQQD